jgi:hypothetical protein
MMQTRMNRERIRPPVKGEFDFLLLDAGGMKGNAEPEWTGNGKNRRKGNAGRECGKALVPKESGRRRN